MKKSEFVQIKGLDIKELKNKAKSLREEIANLTMDKNMKKIKDVKTVSKKKKELAQVLTLVRQKELLAQLESQTQEDSEKLRKPANQKIGKSEDPELRSSGAPSHSEKSKARVKKGAKK